VTIKTTRTTKNNNRKVRSNQTKKGPQRACEKTRQDTLPTIDNKNYHKQRRSYERRTER